MRNIFKWIGIILGSIILLVWVGIMINKNKIKVLVQTQLNNNINGTFAFNDLDLSIIRSFPYFGIDLSKVNLVDHTSDTVMRAENIGFKFNLRKLIFSKFQELEIKQVILIHPELYTRVNAEGEFNLGKIVKEKQSNSGSFQLQSKLEKIQIENGTFSHSDYTSDPYSIYLDQLNTTAYGTLTSSDLKLEFTNLFDHFTYVSENVTFLENVKGSWAGVLIYNISTGDWIVNKNQISLNTLKTNINGDIKSIKSVLWFDLEVNIPENNITDLISIIPGAMANQFDKLSATGRFTLNGAVKGSFDSVGHKPILSFKSAVTDADIKYNHLPYSLSSFNLDWSVQSLDSIARKFHFQVSKLNANLNGEPVNAVADIMYDNGYVSNAKGYIKANLKLDDIQKMFPLNQTMLSGLAHMDLVFDFSEFQVRQKLFDQMKLNGKLDGTKLKIKLSGNPEFSIDKLASNFTPKSADIIVENGKYGNSDLAGQVQITNPLALATTFKNLATITINSTSELLDVNQLTDWDCDTCDKSSQMNDMITRLRIQFNSKIRNTKYHDYKITNTSFTGSFIRDSLRIKSASSDINGSRLIISGNLNNPYKWSFDKSLLTGNLSVSTEIFDCNPYLDTATVNSTSYREYEKVLPPNTSLQLDIKSSDVLYRQFKLSDLKSKATLINQNLNIESGNAVFAGGNVGLTGIFSESEKLPSFDFKLDLNQMKVDEALKNTNSFVKIAPLATYVGGIFSTSSILQGSLDADMNPIWSNFDAAGVLEVINGKLKDFKPLEEISKKIKIPILKYINWEKSKNWFVIEKGKVNIKPFVIPNKEIFIQLQGSHHIEQNIDYRLTTGIPKKLFDYYKVNPYLNPDLAWVRDELKSKGIPIQEIDTLYFETSITGKINAPVVTTKWVAKPGGKTYSDQMKEDIEKAVRGKADSIKEAIESKVEAKKDSLIDLLKNEVNLKKGQIDSFTKVINDSIKKIAEARSKELIDSVIRKETTRILDSSLQSKLDTLLHKNSKEEIEKINEKLKNWNPLKKKKKEN